jgi:hypothetical protein
MVEREFDNRTSLIIDPPDGKIPPLTPAAQQRQAKVQEARLPAGQASSIRSYYLQRPRLGGNFGGSLRYYRFCKRRDTWCC